MNDNRRVARHRVLKGAKIAFGRASIIDVTMRNISDRGACLRVASPVGIPDTFNLVMVDGQKRPCRLVWRKEKEIGVEFADADLP
jgi:PilZ domain